jgi:spore coat polysaccharide biosynthesis protein SpsF
VNEPRTVAIVQARMGSSRLPGKVLADIAGVPMLLRVITRVAAARSIDDVVVATTHKPIDDPIERVCTSASVYCYRGSEGDVLDRLNRAARAVGAEIIVRITADCPLIDGEEIDLCVSHLRSSSGTSGRWDFVTNRLPPPWPRTYPIGLDAECCWRSTLERAAHEATLPHQREHVMPYIYENARIFDALRGATIEPEITGKGAFRVLVLNLTDDLGAIRWTVDTADDLTVVRGIYDALSPSTTFSWREALAAALSRPGLLERNASTPQRQVHDVDEKFRSEK